MQTTINRVFKTKPVTVQLLIEIGFTPIGYYWHLFNLEVIEQENDFYYTKPNCEMKKIRHDKDLSDLVYGKIKYLPI